MYSILTDFQRSCLTLFYDTFQLDTAIMGLLMQIVQDAGTAPEVELFEL